MRRHWLQLALADLEGIGDYFGLNSPIATNGQAGNLPVHPCRR